MKTIFLVVMPDQSTKYFVAEEQEVDISLYSKLLGAVDDNKPYEIKSANEIIEFKNIGLNLSIKNNRASFARIAYQDNRGLPKEITDDILKVISSLISIDKIFSDNDTCVYMKNHFIYTQTLFSNYNDEIKEFELLDNGKTYKDQDGNKYLFEYDKLILEEGLG